MTMEADRRQASFIENLLPWLLTAGGLIGLGASMALTVEKLALLSDADYVPTCSINPVLSCGSIMRTEQSELFGFPNPLLGIAGFAVLTTVGVALFGGARFPRWFWLGLQTGVTLGVVLIHWLIYQSLYVIDALCPYCMVVWAVTIPVFCYVTLHNLRHSTAARGLVRYHGVLLTTWYVLIIIAVAQAFWTYWRTLL